MNGFFQYFIFQFIIKILKNGHIMKSDNRVRIPELLSPAGDFASLNAAISSGADSVYIGIAGLNLRAHRSNFQLEDLKMAVKRCHDSDVKLYLCTNTIMQDKNIIAFKKSLNPIKTAEVDAIIASDLGIIKIARENDLNVHMSVQANASNLETIKLLKELGVSRVILSRDLSLEEIRSISTKSPLEVEVFVHGALCLAVSGRCFLSSYFYNKSANCGECLQPCRKNWKLSSEDGKELLLKTYNKEDNPNDLYPNSHRMSHLMSPQDLCMVEYLPELIQAGIDAFKIEGRSRAADYVATVTSIYREALENYNKGNWRIDDKWIKELKKVYNRGFCTGFYFQTPYETSKYNESTHKKMDIGLVCNYYSKVSAAEIKLTDDLELQDEIIIIGPTTGSVTQKVESMQINCEDIEKAHKGQNVAILVKDKVRPNDIVYRRVKKV